MLECFRRYCLMDPIHSPPGTASCEHNSETLGGYRVSRQRAEARPTSGSLFHFFPRY